MGVSYEKALPPEQWRQVLVNVSPGDLCSVMRTSSYMNSVASWPNLWAEMPVNMGKIRDNGLAELYSIDRFRKIRKITFVEGGFNAEQLEMVLHDIPASPFKDINLSCVDLSQVLAELLARAVSCLQTVNLRNSSLTTEQCIQMLEASLSTKCLVDVDLSGINLRQVPSELLANAVSRLQTVNLEGTKLTTKQCIQMLNFSLFCKSLVDVNLRYIDLSEVPSDLLARAVSRLQTVVLHSTKLTTEQCIQLLQVSVSSKSLVDVNLVYVNLSGVPSDLLARAITHLQTVNLTYTYLTTEQCIQVLEVSLSSRSLVDVNLLYVNLSGVPSNLLARAVSRLQTVNLWKTKLTTEQCIQVLEASLSSRSLVEVNLTGVNLSGVSSDLLSSAVSRLQTADLSFTNLTTEQCIQVVEASISSKTLVNVNIGGTYNSVHRVPKESLAQAEKKLTFFYSIQG